MSSANRVPETYGLDGDDAAETLRTHRTGVVARDAYLRLRYADGFSHARALAYQAVLALLPGVIVAVGFAVRFDSALSRAIRETIDSLAPGPAGELFRAAFEHGASTDNRSGTTALVLGSLAMFVAGTTAFGQLERAANRIYGLEVDRPSVAKYRHAALLAVTAGVLLAGFVVAIAIGRAVASSLDPDGATRTAFLLTRWPLGVLMLAAAIALVMRSCPNRHQPAFTWLTVGSAISVAVCLAVAVVLHVYLDLSKSFGHTYGPIAGFIGVLIWANASAVGVLYGFAFAAQLEAVRAGCPEPREPQRQAEHSLDHAAVTAAA